MSATATNDEFLLFLRDSGLVAPDVLSSLLDPALPPVELANRLVRKRLLTAYQAEQLLQGDRRGLTIGKFRVLERLGSGSSGFVYLVQQPDIGRKAAIKMLPCPADAGLSTVERFKREARALAGLDHPNVVQVFDFDRDGERLFLVMEYVDGVSLQDLVKRHGPLGVLQAAHYVRQAATGLQHLHEAGLIHRDIKPANLMVDTRGTIKILDLGLTRFLDEAESLTADYDAAKVLGTADYLAPEQAVNSHEVDIRADVYGLGATFYFLVTGATPFPEGTAMQKLLWVQMRPPQPVRELCPDLPEDVAAIIEQMMAKDPADRFATPGEVVHALAPWTERPAEPLAAGTLPRPRSRVEVPVLTVPPPSSTRPRLAEPPPKPEPEPASPAAETDRPLALDRPTEPNVAPVPVRPLAVPWLVLPKSPESAEGRFWFRVAVVALTVLLSAGIGIVLTVLTELKLP
jgi:eukaryotic-like serine/threonine-protein kinase